MFEVSGSGETLQFEDGEHPEGLFNHAAAEQNGSR